MSDNTSSRQHQEVSHFSTPHAYTPSSAFQHSYPQSNSYPQPNPQVLHTHPLSSAFQHSYPQSNSYPQPNPQVLHTHPPSSAFQHSYPQSNSYPQPNLSNSYGSEDFEHLRILRGVILLIIVQSGLFNFPVRAMNWKTLAKVNFFFDGVAYVAVWFYIYRTFRKKQKSIVTHLLLTCIGISIVANMSALHNGPMVFIKAATTFRFLLILCVFIGGSISFISTPRIFDSFGTIVGVGVSVTLTVIAFALNAHGSSNGMIPGIINAVYAFVFLFWKFFRRMFRRDE